MVEIHYYESFDELIGKYPNKNFYYASTKGEKFYTSIKFTEEDFIVFGKETKGLPEDILNGNLENIIKIPMREDLKRSLNLANSVNIILFEALRQLDFPFLK